MPQEQLMSPVKGESVAGPQDSGDRASPSLPRFPSMKARSRGDNSARGLWGEIKWRAIRPFGAVAEGGGSSHGGVHGLSPGHGDGSSSPIPNVRRPGGMLASRIASRLRRAKGANSSVEVETAEPLDGPGNTTPRRRSQLVAVDGAGEGTLDGLATPRAGPGRRWLPSGRLLRSTSCVQSGILEPRNLLPPPDDDDDLHDDARKPSTGCTEDLTGGEAKATTLEPMPAPGCNGVTRPKVDAEAMKEAAQKLRAQMSSLEELDPATRRTGYDAQYDLLRKAEKQALLKPVATAALMANRAKNRYHDILPFDSTRVILQGPAEDAAEWSDYINASHIDGLKAPEGEVGAGVSLPHYIAAQGPLEHTIADFWLMAQQQKCVAVLMLSKEVEGTKVKCGHYFPLEVGSEDYGYMRVTTLAVEALEGARGTTHRRLCIEDTRCLGSTTELSHFHYEDWPDHGAPKTTSPVRQLIRHVRRGPLSSGPFIVHCSAGIGRTGTYCCVDFTVRRLLAGDLSALDIPATIGHMRTQRTGMVQSRDQFRFCYAAILDELEEFVQDPSLAVHE